MPDNLSCPIPMTTVYTPPDDAQYLELTPPIAPEGISAGVINPTCSSASLSSSSGVPQFMGPVPPFGFTSCPPPTGSIQADWSTSAAISMDPPSTFSPSPTTAITSNTRLLDLSLATASNDTYSLPVAAQQKTIPPGDAKSNGVLTLQEILAVYNEIIKKGNATQHHIGTACLRLTSIAMRYEAFISGKDVPIVTMRSLWINFERDLAFKKEDMYFLTLDLKTIITRKDLWQLADNFYEKIIESGYEILHTFAENPLKLYTFEELLHFAENHLRDRRYQHLEYLAKMHRNGRRIVRDMNKLYEEIPREQKNDLEGQLLCDRLNQQRQKQLKIIDEIRVVHEKITHTVEVNYPKQWKKISEIRERCRRPECKGRKCYPYERLKDSEEERARLETIIKEIGIDIQMKAQLAHGAPRYREILQAHAESPIDTKNSILSSLINEPDEGKCDKRLSEAPQYGMLVHSSPQSSIQTFPITEEAKSLGSSTSTTIFSPTSAFTHIQPKFTTAVNYDSSSSTGMPSFPFDSTGFMNHPNHSFNSNEEIVKMVQHQIAEQKSYYDSLKYQQQPMQARRAIEEMTRGQAPQINMVQNMSTMHGNNPQPLMQSAPVLRPTARYPCVPPSQQQFVHDAPVRPMQAMEQQRAQEMPNMDSIHPASQMMPLTPLYPMHFMPPTEDQHSMRELQQHFAAQAQYQDRMDHARQQFLMPQFHFRHPLNSMLRVRQQFQMPNMRRAQPRPPNRRQ
ncbi:unnamed protein product [Caenorhabditis bovis]|uniref:Uncharacterized protein n=1 Tax=Caenorhabditis bovis TaxID=2654633 RepID=A0A8S1F3R2_9PELO|nr:unnamed protein product [Caenorhabditis bovis]